MGVVIMGKFGERGEEALVQEPEISKFTLEAFQSAVEQERYLPWDLAVTLVRQIMIDHGIQLKDLKA